MLPLDTTTLLFGSALLTVLCAVYFVLNTAFGINDRAGRMWSLAFLAGIVVTGIYVVWSVGVAEWWVIAVGNGMFAFAAGMFWSGARAFNGRAGWAVCPVLAALAVAGFAALGRRVPDGWGGSVELFVAIAVFGILASVEIMRGVGRGSLNGRIFSVVMGLSAVAYLVRAVALQVLGPTDAVFRTWFGTAGSTSLSIVLTFSATVTLTVLRMQVTRYGPLYAVDDGVLMDPGRFDVVARSWLSRARLQRSGMALAEVRFHGLQEIVVAFGAAAREAAVGDFVKTVAEAMPPASLPTRASDDRLLVLFPAPDLSVARRAVRRIVTAAESYATGTVGLPMTIGIGVAHTAEVGYGLSALERDAAGGEGAVMTTVAAAPDHVGGAQV